MRRTVSRNGATSSGPEYRELARIPDMFPGVPRIALTATADPRTQQDILAALRMERARSVRLQLPPAESAAVGRGQGGRDGAVV